ncbi:lipoprotein [Bradyrhizobium sp. URHD0069]|uniref:apolipoprotein A-IV repeat region-like domain-containing protein n=1 Tax=Bradyrhizobium sp. URHD0069 TaxID=1380355 RepID=UPI000497302D|nr:lipoprotein [Bradyrhizobium sp. URHD0069]
MANNPKKVKDPTEVALSAIQEALNISDVTAAEHARNSGRSDVTPANSSSPGYDESVFDARPGTDRPIFEPIEEPRPSRRAANDDRETIGQILQAIQQGRPARNVYTLATLFAGVWILGAALLTLSFLPSLQAAIGQGSGGTLVLAGLAALFFAPILLFYFLASLSWRGQELRMIAQSMAQVAIRFSEPESAASDSMVTVGQAIRREVAAMGDGVERAIARAGELETLVANEVSALERAYSDNEVRIRALLQDIAHQRDNLVGQAEQVRSAISGVQIDLRHDIALISDAIASRVDEVAKTITGALEERGAHITQALSNAGDNMILALGERGGDLLDRLEEASAETARAVLDASERLTTSLNFKTGHVHDEFVDLADRVHEMLNERLDRITSEFELRSSTIVDGISDRTEQVHDSLKNSSDSLLLELELRGGDLVGRIDEAGNRLAAQILTSGDKANEALDVTVNSLVAKVVSQTETAHDSLSLQMSAFDELVKNQGGELAEKFARDSGSLGALITRHISEFDRTVKTFGGEIVDRMGQRTQDIAETLKTYVDNFDTRLASNSGEITASLDQRLLQFETTLGTSVANFDTSLDGKIKSFDESIDGRLKSLEQTFDTRAKSVTETIDGHLGSLATSLTDGAAQAIHSIDSRVTLLASSLTDGTVQAIEAIDRRIANVTETIDGRTAHLTDAITARFQEIHQGIETRVGGVASDIDIRVAQFEDLLGSRVEAVAGRIESSGRQASEGLMARAEELSLGIKSHVEDAERSLTTLVVSTSETIQTGARAAQQSLLSVSSDVGAQLKLTSAEVERALTAVGTGAADSIVTSARDAQATMMTASGEAATQIKSLSADVERTLSAAGAASAASILSSAREVQTTLVTASADASNQIKAISTEIERSLSTATASTTDNIMSSAQSAQSALLAASNEVTSKVKSASTEVERSVLAASNTFGSTMTGKTDEIVNYVQQQTDRLAQMIDGKRGTLVEAISAKTNQLTVDIDRVTSDALKSIETRGQTFSQSVLSNGSDVARTITSAGELATGAMNRSLKDLDQASRAVIDQSRQVSVAAVTEMQETSKILRTDTVALFERLREGNILLQEVLTGAHDNLNSLERALVNRVADFVSAMNDVTSRNGVATQTLEDQLNIFNAKTGKALENLGSLSSQFETHGKTLVDAAAVVEQSNRSTNTSLAERKSALESLVTTIDLRTADLDQRLSRFTGLLDESLAAAEERARDIARIVAETAGAGSAAINRQFEAVRSTAEEERRLTAEAMNEIYQQSTQEADAMFKQSAEKFADMVTSMKQMAAEMHNELESTRNELRRGVLEMPHEAAESTAQMRKVIVDQIEALAELNRIVAHHGRGLDVVTAGRSNSHRQEEPMLATASGSRGAPRMRDGGSASTLPPPDLGLPASHRTEAPPVSPASSDQGRDGWLSDLLNRTDAAGANRDVPRGRPPQQAAGGNPLESLSLDIGRLMDRNLAVEMWDRYQRGESKAFSKRLYTPAGQKAFDEVVRKYRADRNFKQTVDRYITEFERLLDEVTRDERGPAVLRSHLTSETGLVYTLLAHAAGRLG